MPDRRITLIASGVVFWTGVFWGFYWLPVRSLEEAGLAGAWGTVAITLATLVLLIPVAIRRAPALRRANPVAMVSLAIGGAAFTFYSVGFVHGRVAIIVLLYCLTPVWSALIGRFVMGWPITPKRSLAIVLGLLGLAIMLGSTGEAPIPRGPGEWMALVGGFLWAVGTTGMRAKSDLAPPDAVLLFVVGAFVTALAVALILDPIPAPGAIDRPIRTVGITIATGGIWWALSVGGLMWATVRLEPVRVGLLLYSEVLTGAVSAALIAGEHLHPLELAGGALVIFAGIADLWPDRHSRPSQTPT